jgi:hypothetical protein
MVKNIRSKICIDLIDHVINEVKNYNHRFVLCL